MITLNSKEQKIISILLEKKSLKSSEVHIELDKQGEKVSLVTVKRMLSDLEARGLLVLSGSGRSTSYTVSNVGRMFTDINAKSYSSVDPDKRFGLKSYNFDLLDAIPPNLFTNEELERLESATLVYRSRVKDLPTAIEEKELERFIIELSWKSSKIEGNTYTLLDTEKLILKGIEAPGHDKNEARMILNHKEAFSFVRANIGMFRELTRANLEEVHKILVKDLNINIGLRTKPVGITGSVYNPLDNVHQIGEAVESLTKAVYRMKNSYEKAMVALLGLSYVQPFEDGNKRSSRLIANALLLAHKHAPLSYRSVEENDYREAILVFYEINSIMPFKKIFVEQYDFAARNYAVK